MRKAIMLVLISALETQALSLTVGGGVQREQFSGWIQYKGTSVDVKKDLNLSDKTKPFIFADLRHDLSLLFIPLPNLRFEFLKMDTSGTGTINRQITIGGITFDVNEKIYSYLRLDQYDFSFYYEPIDVKAARLSWGLGVKVIDFKESVKSLTTGLSQSKSLTVPLPYLQAGGDLNLKPIYASFNFKGLKVGGSYFYDWRAEAGLKFKVKGPLSLKLGGGYRYQRYRIDDVSDVSADLKVKGAFGAASLDFAF